MSVGDILSARNWSQRKNGQEWIASAELGGPLI